MENWVYYSWIVEEIEQEGTSLRELKSMPSSRPNPLTSIWDALRLNPAGGNCDVKSLVVTLPYINSFTWLLFGSHFVLCRLFNAICLALFDWLVVMNEFIMSYVVLVCWFMCRFPSMTAEGLWLVKAGARGHHHYSHDDSVGLQVGQYTMSSFIQ